MVISAPKKSHIMLYPSFSSHAWLSGSRGKLGPLFVDDPWLQVDDVDDDDDDDDGIAF
jgi:hypothetical protein